jgi:hypothetical protein
MLRTNFQGKWFDSELHAKNTVEGDTSLKARKPETF